jgi:CheY-like chemotaxis protein/HPt (histidine-containing phosphotransfer) domain-containing protein
MLHRLGYNADIAANGLEVLSALANNPYDVVLMDVQMPEMDGMEATRRIRGSPMPQPRIIAMTAHAAEEDRQACLAAGMDDYINKPVDIRKLDEALARAQRRESHATGAPPGPATATSSAATIPPLAGPATPLPVLDHAVLDGLRRDLGGEEAVRELIRTYLDEAPALLKQISEAVAHRDAHALDTAAHTLKSASATVGALRLSALSKDLEAIGKAGLQDMVSTAPKVAQILAEAQEAREMLHARLSAP